MGHYWKIEVDPEAQARWLERENAALVGSRLMESYQWQVGETVVLPVLNNSAFVIAGVFTAGGSALETRAISGRAFVQKAMDLQGVCNNIVVQVDDTANADAVVQYIDREMSFPKKTHTKREKAFLAAIADEMKDMLAFSRWIVLSTLLVVLMGVANTVSMSMRDRIAEVGVLRTLGFKRFTVLGLVLTESTLVALVGGVLAVPLILGGLAAFAAVVGELNVRGVGVQVSIEPTLMLLCLPVAALAGGVGGVIPAFFASRWKIVNCFRAVD